MMQKRTLLLFALIAFLLTGSVIAQDCDIEIQVKNAPGDTCYLAHYYSGTQYIDDTLLLNDKGAVQILHDDILPGGMYIFILNDSIFMDVILDSDQKFQMNMNYPYLSKTVAFKGSKENEAFYSYMNTLEVKREVREQLLEIKGVNAGSGLNNDEIVVQLNSLDEEVQKIQEHYMNSNPKWLSSAILKMNKPVIVPEEIRNDRNASFYYYRNHFLDHLDLQDARLSFTPSFHLMISQFMSKLVVQYPDSVIAGMEAIHNKLGSDERLQRYFYNYIISKYQIPDKMGTDAAFVYLVDNYLSRTKTPWLDTVYHIRLKDRADHIRQNMLGKVAPDFIAASPTGRYTRLSEVAGKFTILFFYNYTCHHCKATTPKLKALYEKYRSAGVKVIAFNSNDELKPWLEYIEEQGIQELVNVSDVHGNTDFRMKYDVVKVPKLLLLDENRRILAKGLTVEQLEQFIGMELGK